MVDDFADYLRTIGVMTDEEIDALAGGPLNTTVSLRAAIAQRQGRQWGCVLCWFLDWAVQPGHCAAQFTPGRSPWWVGVRAGACFCGLLVALHPTWRWVAWWLAAMALNAAVGVAMLVKGKR